jgi:DNA processing protein
MTDAAWVALSLVDRVGGKTLRALMQHFNHNPQAILNADVDALRQVPGIGPKIAHNIRAVNISVVEQAIPRWVEAGIQLITFNDAAYPPRLRQLDDAPPTLFVRGAWQPRLDKSIAIVGRRKPSPSAYQIAQNLGSELAQKGYTIISGLAYGIDYAAHQGALAIDGGTIAVLGSGVLNIYPADHASLAQAMLRRGAIVSEVQPNAQPNSANLVARNRIITGLSDAVVIVETDIDGGAMYAARFALAQGRTVYAVDNGAGGNRELLAKGAVPIRPDLRDLPF